MIELVVGTKEAQRSAEEGGKRRSEGEESAEEQTDMKTEGPLLAGGGQLTESRFHTA